MSQIETETGPYARHSADVPVVPNRPTRSKMSVGDGFRFGFGFAIGLTLFSIVILALIRLVGGWVLSELVDRHDPFQIERPSLSQERVVEAPAARTPASVERWVLSDLNARTGPGTDHEVLGQVAPGQRIVGLPADCGWFRSEEGWFVMSSLLLSSEAEYEACED